MYTIEVSSLLEWKCKINSASAFKIGTQLHAIVRHERGFSQMTGVLKKNIELSKNIGYINIDGWEEKTRCIIPDFIVFDNSMFQPKSRMIQLLRLRDSEEYISNQMVDLIKMVRLRIHAQLFKEIKHCIKTNQEKIDWIMGLDV